MSTFSIRITFVDLVWVNNLQRSVGKTQICQDISYHYVHFVIFIKTSGDTHMKMCEGSHSISTESQTYSKNISNTDTDSALTAKRGLIKVNEWVTMAKEDISVIITMLQLVCLNRHLFTAQLEPLKTWKQQIIKPQAQAYSIKTPKVYTAGRWYESPTQLRVIVLFFCCLCLPWHCRIEWVPGTGTEGLCATYASQKSFISASLTSLHKSLTSWSPENTAAR